MTAGWIADHEWMVQQRHWQLQVTYNDSCVLDSDCPEGRSRSLAMGLPGAVKLILQ